RELASNGANIVLNGFGDPEAIEKERVNIELEYDVKVYYLNADLSQAAGTRAFIAEAAGKLGGLDILVNNAGIQHTDLIEDFPIDK
ncbi:SDR family NAD(P)-dependent oxidoreductase, partial [Ciceribacter ferrooxidans]